MPGLLPASPGTVRPKVLPIDGVPSKGLEDNTMAGGGLLSVTVVVRDDLIAFNEATPPLIETQASQQRELGAATHEPTVVVGYPGHKATHPAPTPKGRAPVVVVAVVAACSVPLGAQALYPDLVAPALERPRARLDAPHLIRARDEGDLGVADGLVAMGHRAAVVSDG